MTTYVVAHLVIEDPDRYGTYAAAFRPIFARHHGTIVLVDDTPHLVEGALPEGRLLIGRFPDTATALRWYHSADYQAIRPDRLTATTTSFVIVGEQT